MSKWSLANFGAPCSLLLNTDVYNVIARLLEHVGRADAAGYSYHTIYMITQSSHFFSENLGFF